jgi:uncharacterized repeat protein (TIGR03803 family)
MNKDGSAFVVLHIFSGADDGAFPAASLLEGSDGSLYGTTEFGGSLGDGTVFRLSMDGSNYVILHAFAASGEQGREPESSLVEGSDGRLYGTAYTGGNFLNAGTVFSLNKDGTGFAVLHTFGISATEGRRPQGGLIEGDDGALYGTTQAGGYWGNGSVFKLNKDGTGLATLHSFDGNDGSGPAAALIRGIDGALYGTAQFGSSSNQGTVFRLNQSGDGFTVLHSFASQAGDGVEPQARLLEGGDGALYGTTVLTLFRLNKDGSGYSVLHTFSGADGSSPRSELVQARDGLLYGTTMYGGLLSHGGTVFRLEKDGSNFAVLHYFNDGDGRNPQAGLLAARDGALYGTTQNGGAFGVGSVFRLERDGSGYLVLHDFRDVFSDGQQPVSSVVEGLDGALYGTTLAGGSNTYACGTVFRLNKDGSGYAVLRSFGWSWNPVAGLVEGTDGALYGTTQGGGFCGEGSVFKLNKDGGGFAVVHSFSPYGVTPEGAYPAAGVLEASDGKLYGTTSLGSTPDLHGTVFSLNKDGSGFEVMHIFAGVAGDGQNPKAGLIEGSDGALYGTTYYGGTGRAGTVFKLNKDATGYKVLHNFGATPDDGSLPRASLTESVDGALYGTTQSSSASYVAGTVFKLNKDGSGFAVLRSFTGTGAEGKQLYAGLVAGNDGTLYGTCYNGGISDFGVVFRLSLVPRIDSLGISAGGAVRVLVSGLSGTALTIQASTNLLNWADLVSGIISNGQFTADDPGGGQFAHRFYRGKL